MAVRPQDVNSTRDKLAAEAEKFNKELASQLFQRIALLQEESAEINEKLEDLLTTIETLTNKKLEKAVEEIEKTATFFTDERISAQNTILSGVGDQISEIGDAFRQRVDKTSLIYENNLEKITKKAEADEHDGIVFNITKNTAEVAKAGLLWAVFLGACFFLIQYFFVNKLQ